MIEISKDIREYLTGLLGQEKADLYFDFIKKEHSSYIRINRMVRDREKLLAKLSSYGIVLEKIPYLPDAYKVISGIESAGKTLEYNIGQYYIQSLSSMIPPIILDPRENEVVLDMCAAPGSKATQIAEYMNNHGTFITNELSMNRVKMLVHNLEKMDIINTGVLNYKGEWLSRIYNNHFDKILLDAPCSALGVIQKKEEVSNWWSIDRAEKIASLQLMLISAAIKMLKTGGELVYSTCTLTPEENEMIINFVLNKYPLEAVDISLPVNSVQGYTSYKGQKLHEGLSKSHRIIPWEVESEGFFIIKLRKTGETESAKPLPESGKKNLKIISAEDKEIRPHLQYISERFGIDKKQFNNYKFLIKGSDIFITDRYFSTPHLEEFSRIGTKFAVLDKHGKAHMHSYAARILAEHVTRNVYTMNSPEQLKSYFAGGIVRTGTDEEGQHIMKYEDYILGTATAVTGGLKSQYPKSKRIHEIVKY